jgi:hypothetical protein
MELATKDEPILGKFKDLSGFWSAHFGRCV